MDKALVDTDIIIKVFRGSKNHKAELEKIKSENIIISHITVLELYGGYQSIKGINLINEQIKAYNKLPIDKNISLKAIELFTKYISKKMQIPDCLIAASAMTFNLPFYTDNKTHFDYISGIKLYEG